MRIFSGPNTFRLQRKRHRKPKRELERRRVVLDASEAAPSGAVPASVDARIFSDAFLADLRRVRLEPAHALLAFLST